MPANCPGSKNVRLSFVVPPRAPLTSSQQKEAVRASVGAASAPPPAAAPDLSSVTRSSRASTINPPRLPPPASKSSTSQINWNDICKEGAADVLSKLVAGSPQSSQEACARVRWPHHQGLLVALAVAVRLSFCLIASLL